MRWIEAVIPTSSEELDALCESLSELKYWDYVDDALAARFSGLSRVKFYLQDDAEGCAALERIRAALGREILTQTLEEEDWANSWKRYYEPIPVGNRLLIVPEWLEAGETGRTVLRLDPGIAFGTGSHATTRMCLEALERVAEPGKTVLDLGCGSGILGIAALCLGCESVRGCDIDPKAPEAAVRNAALNGIGEDRFRVFAGDDLDGTGPVVVFRSAEDGDGGLILDLVLAAQGEGNDVETAVHREVKPVALGGVVHQPGPFAGSGQQDGEYQDCKSFHLSSRLDSSDVGRGIL